MKSLVTPLLVCALFGAVAHGQAVRLSDHVFRPHQVTASVERLQGAEVLKVVKDVSVSEVDAPTFARLQDVDFKDGTIEVKVFSRLLKTAPAMARGFIGIAFRIAEDNSKFESIYIRPTNGRAEDQLRRNRSVQYFAYPDFKFDRLRKEAAGVYETYADMELDEWIALRIEVTGKQAKLFLNDSRQPVLVVNELKLGESTSGAIALWVDVGTEGYFKDLKISRR